MKLYNCHYKERKKKEPNKNVLNRNSSWFSGIFLRLHHKNYFEYFITFLNWGQILVVGKFWQRVLLKTLALHLWFFFEESRSIFIEYSCKCSFNQKIYAWEDSCRYFWIEVHIFCNKIHRNKGFCYGIMFEYSKK